MIWFQLFSIECIEGESDKYEYGAEPLTRQHGMLKDENRGEYSEEFPSRRGNGTRQRPEVCHNQKYEVLKT